MKRVHITEKTPRRPYPGFWAAFAVAWIVPLVILLATFRWQQPTVFLRLLCKSTWVLYAGQMLSWIPVSLTDIYGDSIKKWYILFAILGVVSFFLLPFGLGHWDYYGSYYGFCLNPSWHYADNLFLSFLLHIFPVALIVWLADDGSTGSLSGSSSWQPDYGQTKTTSNGSGISGGHSWLDDVWMGGQISDDFYGKHGEFDRNDESRRISEDMQQFSSANPDADLSDHYYWDDIVDADTDGYLED